MRTVRIMCLMRIVRVMRIMVVLSQSHGESAGHTLGLEGIGP